MRFTKMEMSLLGRFCRVKAAQEGSLRRYGNTALKETVLESGLMVHLDPSSGASSCSWQTIE